MGDKSPKAVQKQSKQKQTVVNSAKKKQQDQIATKAKAAKK